MENDKCFVDGCQNESWDIKTKFSVVAEIEPMIMLDVSDMTDEEIQELFNEVNGI